eukprot:13314529-Alexandrium_andersonii.AAC.1
MARKATWRSRGATWPRDGPATASCMDRCPKSSVDAVATAGHQARRCSADASPSPQRGHAPYGLGAKSLPASHS